MVDKGKRNQDFSDQEYIPWVEKYRPTSIQDIVSHGDILRALENLIISNQLPHMLFYGPPGTGKTTTILAVARKIYGVSYKSYVMELNASDDRGIEIVREKIKNFASTKQVFENKYKLIILDEADSITLVAQNALRRIIEKYTMNARFCLICNYINKITLAIQSRCTRFRFQPLPQFELEVRLDYVLGNEQLTLSTAGRQALLRQSKGDMRRMLSILQSCSGIKGEISSNDIYGCTGNPSLEDINSILKSIMNSNFTTAFKYIESLQKDYGFALNDVVTGLFEKIDELQISDKMRIYVYDSLAEIEYRLSTCNTQSKIQSSAVIAAIKLGCEIGDK